MLQFRHYQLPFPIFFTVHQLDLSILLESWEYFALKTATMEHGVKFCVIASVTWDSYAEILLSSALKPPRWRKIPNWSISKESFVPSSEPLD